MVTTEPIQVVQQQGNEKCLKFLACFFRENAGDVTENAIEKNKGKTISCKILLVP
jgi:hypothetical protein